MSAPNPKHLTLRSMPLKSLIPVSSLNKTSAGVSTGIIASSPPIYGKKWVPRMRANNIINKKTNPIPISGGGGGGGGGGMSRVRALIPGTDFGGLRKSVVQKIWEGWGVISLAGFSGSTPPGDAKRGNTDSNININSSSSNNNRRRKTTTANFRRVPAPGPLMGSHKIKEEEEEGQGQQKGNTHLQNPTLPHSSKFLTLPTILTLGRVAAVPLLVSIFYLDGRWATTITTGIFIAAAITDWLDGYIARKMRLGSAFGAFLDPVADKLMVAATLVLLCTRPLEVATFGKVPWLLTVPTIAIIGREITMSAVREWAASQNSKVLEAVAVNNLGKWKTATQMIALTILLVARDCSLTGSGVLVSSGVVLLYISSWLAVWSLAVYMKKIWRVLLK